MSLRRFMRGLAFVLVTMLSQTVFPQRYNFMHISTDDGLSHNNVKSIVRDIYGFIWIGTKKGLDWYDGRTVHHKNCIDVKKNKVGDGIASLYDDGKRYLWIGASCGVFRLDHTTGHLEYLDLATDDGVRMDNWVDQIAASENGDIWIVVPNRGVFRYKKGKLECFRLPPTSKNKSPQPSCLTIVDGEIWVGSWRNGLFRFDKAARRFRSVAKDREGFDLTSLEMNRICSHRHDIIIAQQSGEVRSFDVKTYSSDVIAFGNPKGNVVRTVASDGRNIFVGTYKGLYTIDCQTGRVYHNVHNTIDGSSLSDDIIFSLYNDKEGNLWIGTLFGGLCYNMKNSLDFRKIITSNVSQNSLSSNRIRGMACDVSGNLWVGTEGAGINKISPQGTISHFGNPNSTVLQIRDFDNTIYCGLFYDGLLVIPSAGTHRLYTTQELGVDDPSVFTFFIDNKGYKWIGNGRGAWRAEPGTMAFRPVRALAGVWVHDIQQDPQGNIWFAANCGGVWRMDIHGKVTHFQTGDSGLLSDIVTSVFIDRKGRAWFTTDNGGISVYEPSSRHFLSYSTKDGLPDDVAYGMIDDDKGNLWFGTNKGIVCFNPHTKSVKVYNKSHGLLGNEFNYSSVSKDKDGTLYMGGQAGIVAFHPRSASSIGNKDIPLYFSRLSVNGKDEETSVGQMSAGASLTVPYDSSNVSIELSMPVFWGGKSIRYYYKLEPLDKNWVPATDNVVNLIGLAPGKYMLHVKGFTADGHESFNTLPVRITPPWYLSVWAYIVYALLLVLLVVLVIICYKRRKEKQFAQLQRMIDVENEKEIYETKVGFFTEVAHEIRTPLTLITAPVEAIKELDIKNKDLAYNLATIESNTSRLLELVAQILDLEQVGRNKYVLTCSPHDVCFITNAIFKQFEATFQREGRPFTMEMPSQPVFADIDPDAVIKIISNLLSNALKYGERSVDVRVETDGTTVSVKVSSDGEPITEELREKIFQPFVRGEETRFLKPGTGLGLGVARALASLLHGRLVLEEAESERNVFVFSLPVCDSSDDNSPKSVTVAASAESEGESIAKKCQILIVEDHEDIREYLSRRLQPYFKVHTASNGKEALGKLHKGGVDLVLTDLMMPEMDGYELCNAIKSDMSLSHIPIVILTAKNDNESRLQSLRTGAEAFIEKPFNFAYLKEQIMTLLRNRQQEREAFARTPYLSLSSELESSADKEFNKKMLSVIEEHIAEEDFNVERLADELCMSRSALFRKLKQLYDVAPVAFIRSIRMKKAAELIATGQYRVGEICNRVGMSSPSYFSRQFQNQFGMTPKAYENECRLRREESQQAFPQQDNSGQDR